MKEIILQKISKIKEKMKALETEHLYYLSASWIELKTQEKVLLEVLKEANIEISVENTPGN